MELWFMILLTLTNYGQYIHAYVFQIYSGFSFVLRYYHLIARASGKQKTLNGNPKAPPELLWSIAVYRVLLPSISMLRILQGDQGNTCLQDACPENQHWGNASPFHLTFTNNKYSHWLHRNLPFFPLRYTFAYL